MTADIFITSVQAFVTLPTVLKNRLIGLAEKLDAAMRDQIVTALRDCERREQVILEEGGRTIAEKEKKVGARSRTTKEEADRSGEQLPDFDS